MHKALLFAFWAVASVSAADKTRDQDEDACQQDPEVCAQNSSFLLQSRSDRLMIDTEEDGVSGSTAWVAGDWSDCHTGCGKTQLKFRIVECRTVFDNKPASKQTDCRGPMPGNAEPCDESEVHETSNCPPLIELVKEGPPGPLSEPVGRFDFTPPDDDPSAGDPSKPMDCEKVDGEEPCMAGLPLFAKKIKDVDAEKCMGFCLSKALDIAGIDSGRTCRCGSSLANQELFSHGEPRKSVVFNPDALKTCSSSSCLEVYRFKGPYEDNGVPDKFNGHNVGDLIYTDSVVAGSDISEVAEEDGDPGDDAVGSLVESEQAPGFSRACWPGNCGPGRGPWRNRAASPVPGAPATWKEYVHIPYTWKPGTDQARKDVFREAVKKWAEHTCINLFYVDELPRPSGWSKYGITTGEYDKSTCWLSGMGDGSSRVNLGWCNNMRYSGSVIHEIGHALGLNHEQKRPDATRNYHGHGPFLRVYWDQIPSTWTPQYTPDDKTYTGSKNDGPGDPQVGWANYDFGSIMHYYADSRYDTNPPEKKSLIGNREHLTPEDMKMILDMYQCKANATTTCGGNAEGTAAEGKACQFPFTYKGTSYFSCTSVNHDQPWCYTTKDGYWGNCNCR